MAGEAHKCAIRRRFRKVTAVRPQGTPPAASSGSGPP